MKVAMVTGPGSAEVVDADTPTVGPQDVLVRIRACGICGSDVFYITIGVSHHGRTTPHWVTNPPAK
jgi:L-iditol 2-dehydrogenase